MKKANPDPRVPSSAERGTDTPEHAAYKATLTDEIPQEQQQWGRGTDLEAPPCRPGYVQCWIRTMLGGEVDGLNIARSMNAREGWKPRLADTVPAGHSAPTLQHASYGEVIGIPGMILCERPVHMQRQRDAYYADVLRKQHESIDRDILKVQRPGMPITQTRRTTVSGAPNPPAFPSDES